MNFQFLAGLREAFQQLLCQVFHYGAAQLRVVAHDILEVLSFDGQQRTDLGTSGRKRITERLYQSADADAAIFRAYKRNGHLDGIPYLY